jgi:LAS superfamily LD-carboxypeptidase LdcB
VPATNIPIFGRCSIRRSGTCSPSISGQWQKGKKNVIIDDAAALMHSSTIKCNVGGIIKIQAHAQGLESDGAVVLPIKKDIQPEEKTPTKNKKDILVKFGGVKAANSTVVLLLNVIIADNFHSFIAECNCKGYSITLNDCFRDIRKQSHFYNLLKNPRNKADHQDFLKHGIKNKVSTPYNSYHNTGLGFDIDYSNLSKSQLITIEAIGHQYGFYRTQITNDKYNEPGHFSYIGKFKSIQKDAVATSLGFKDWKTMVTVVQETFKELGYSSYVCPYGNDCGL